jgi:hypothetical protein
MIASEIISDVRLALVEPVAGFWTDAELLGWINRAESDFVNRTRILEDKDFTSTQLGVNQYPLPSNCLSVRAVMVNIATAGQNANWVRIKPSNLEKFMQETPNFLAVETDQQNDPRAYMIWGRTFFLFPVPKVDGSSNVVLFYKAKPIPLTTVGQSLNLDDSLREAVIAFVLSKAWQKENEDEKKMEQAQIYEGYVRQGLRWQKKQSGDQRNRLDISSPTPFDGPYDTRYNPLQ